VFSQWSGHSDGGTAEVVPFADNWHSLTNGLRTDWSRGADAVVVQGHFTTNTTRPGWLVLPAIDPGQAKTTDGISQGNEASVLGRWTRTRADGTVLQVQAYHTRVDRDETILHFREHTSDIELQYETRLASRHGVVLGGGFRHVDISADDTLTAQMGAHQLETMNLFVQDEIAIRRDLALTLGVKLEYDTFAPLDVLPTARVIWEASPRQRVWAAASRALRTPSLTDRDFRVNLDVLPGPGLPIVVAFFGSPEYRSEELVQTEAGYRVRIGSAAALDVTAFRGSYDGLSTVEPLPPVIETTPAPVHLLAGAAFANLRTARASGVELNAHWMPLPRWQIEASYSFLHLTAEVDPASLDTGVTDGNSAAHQWDLRSTVTVRPGVQAGASVSRVGRLNRLLVPAYTRLDARLEWRLNSRLTAAAVGQNLMTGSHQEFASPLLFLTSGIPRSARLDLRWEF
jgi:iron complex outermembrane receptor protein